MPTPFRISAVSAAAAALVATLGGLSAHAQAPAAASAEPVQRITVTGSNIKRLSKEGTSPIETLTAKDIKDSGAKTVLELMKQVPALGADGFNDTPTQNGFSRSVATASLRSLGSTSTLILLNGRRMTPAAYANPNNGASTLYDLNAIPISALERVEIFKDGASAVYGSDAIGGVINFITKNNYEGIEASVRVGANDDGEFTKNTVSITAGFGNYETNGYNFLISADLTKRGATSMRDGSNDIRADDYRAINLRLNQFNSSLSALPFFTKESAPNSNAFPQNTAASRVVNVTAGCDPAQLITGGAVFGNTTLPLLGRQFCNYDVDQFTDVQSKGSDANVIGRGSFKLGATTMAFAEAAIGQSERTIRGAPRAISGVSPTRNFLLGGEAPSFQAVLDVGHPDNPFNNDPVPGRAALGIRFGSLPAGNTESTIKQYRGLVGVRGTFGNWDWETALLWNRTERETEEFGFLYLPVLRQMLGAPGPTSGRSIASINSDPNLSVPLKNVATAEIKQIDAKVTTEFGKLPGGPIGFAAGIELREESIGIETDKNIAAGNILGLSNTALAGKRNVQSAFFEFRTPLLKSFEMDFAGRFDKYPDLKTNFVPKIGAKWTVNDAFGLRGSFSKGFRAPAVSQVSPGGAQFFVNGLVDPLRCEEDGVTPKPGAAANDCAKSVSGVGTSNPELRPEKSRSASLGFIFSPVRGFDIVMDIYKIKKVGEVALGSAQDVIDKPGNYPPSALTRDTNPALLLNGVPGTGPLLAVSLPWTNQGSTEVSGIDFEFKGSFTADGIRISPSLRGSYALSYRRAEQPGYATFNVVGTNGGYSDWATSVGDIPRMKLRAGSSFESGAHQFSAAMNFVSGVHYRRESDSSFDPPRSYSGNTCHFGGPAAESLSGRTVLGVAPTATNGRDLYINRYPSCSMSSWTTFDVGYTYTGIKDLSVSLNVANLTDVEAPYAPNATISQGYNSGLHNNTGRYFSLSIGYKFR
jgi:iron complex outermembrane recepter protein